ncbi:hypothetical protein WICPIJ_006489, partial [Wickerhamomyces pijperi]
SLFVSSDTEQDLQKDQTNPTRRRSVAPNIHMSSSSFSNETSSNNGGGDHSDETSNIHNLRRSTRSNSKTPVITTEPPIITVFGDNSESNPIEISDSSESESESALKKKLDSNKSDDIHPTANRTKHKSRQVVRIQEYSSSDSESKPKANHKPKKYIPEPMDSDIESDSDGDSDSDSDSDDLPIQEFPSKAKIIGYFNELFKGSNLNVKKDKNKRVTVSESSGSKSDTKLKQHEDHKIEKKQKNKKGKEDRKPKRHKIVIPESESQSQSGSLDNSLIDLDPVKLPVPIEVIDKVEKTKEIEPVPLIKPVNSKKDSGTQKEPAIRENTQQQVSKNKQQQQQQPNIFMKSKKLKQNRPPPQTNSTTAPAKSKYIPSIINEREKPVPRPKNKKFPEDDPRKYQLFAVSSPNRDKPALSFNRTNFTTANEPYIDAEIDELFNDIPDCGNRPSSANYSYSHNPPPPRLSNLEQSRLVHNKKPGRSNS